MIFYEELKFLIPDLFLICAIISIFTYWVITNASNKSNKFDKICIAILIIELLIIQSSKNWNAYFISNIFYIDAFAINFKILLICFGIIAMFFSINYIKTNKEENNNFEQPLFFLLAISGMLVMLEANDFISFYLAFELQSFVLYILAGSDRQSKKSSEAGLKYFILGSFSSACMLFGISLIYLYLGSTNFQAISWLMADGGNKSIFIEISIALALIITGLLFKLPAAPFHNWAPDVYHGAPLHVTAFFSVIPKFAIVAIIIRFLYDIFPTMYVEWSTIILYSGMLSIVVGAIGAYNQKIIKRLLAYSTISHVGFILLSLSTYSLNGLSASCFYLFIYSILSINFFTALFILYYHYKTELIQITDLQDLLEDHPIMGVLLTLNLFSLAGVPPLAGFFSKFYVLTTVIKMEFYFTAIVAIIVSILAAFYYIRLIRIMFFGKDGTFMLFKKHSTYIHSKSEIPISVAVIFSITSIFNLILILCPQPLFLFTSNIAYQFFIT